MKMNKTSEVPEGMSISADLAFIIQTAFYEAQAESNRMFKSVMGYKDIEIINYLNSNERFGKEVLHVITATIDHYNYTEGSYYELTKKIREVEYRNKSFTKDEKKAIALVIAYVENQVLPTTEVRNEYPI